MPIISFLKRRALVSSGLDKKGQKSLEKTKPVSVERPGFESAYDDSPSQAVAGSERNASSTPDRLKEVHRAVLSEVQGKAAQLSKEAMGPLLRRAESFGYSPQEVEKVLAYLRDDAPLTINFSADKEWVSQNPDALYDTDLRSGRLIDAFLSGESYANDFELGIPRNASGQHPGGSRDGWENVIFEGGYHQREFIASDRPKYGALNATKHVAGGAKQYGNSFFILKSNVRARVTVTPFDSSGAKPHHVGTLEHCAHVLLEARNFQGVMEVGLGRKQTDDALDWLYIEAQIHGPMEFRQDIESLVCAPHMRGTDVEVSLRRFCEKNGISLIWMDEPERWR